MEKDIELMDDVALKIKCFIDTYKKKQISFAILVTVLDGMGSTLDSCKEVNRALLNILLEKQDEPESKIETISQNKETQTEEVILDELEVSDDITNVDFEDDTEELPDEIMKVEDEEEEASLVQDDDISSFEANDINEEEADDEYYDLDASRIDMKPKRARLECLICVKTFKYRVQLNKHMNSHDVDESITESDEMNKNGGEIATNEQSTDLLKITKESISGLTITKEDQNIKIKTTNERVGSSPTLNFSMGFEAKIKPFFSSYQRGPNGKWVKALIDVPYQYTYHSSMNGVERFLCNGCRRIKKTTFALVKTIGFEKSGKSMPELISLSNDHKCVPEPNGFLNRVFLDRYST